MTLSFAPPQDDPYRDRYNQGHSQKNTQHGTAVLAYGAGWWARHGASVSRILASDWTKLAGVIIALATTLVMIGRWQGQTEGQLTAILSRLSAIEAQGAAWQVLSQTSATHTYRLQTNEDRDAQLEQRVRALEQRLLTP